MRLTPNVALVLLIYLSRGHFLPEGLVNIVLKETDVDISYHIVGNIKCSDPVAKDCACKLLKLNEENKITLWDRHLSGVKDNATALDNIKDACKGEAASRSNYTCKECPNPGAPGGEVCLHAILLKYMLNLATKIGYIHVNEIAGACHTCKSKHYQGLAVDIDPTKSYDKAKTMLEMCTNMGGKALNETNHIHCQFDN